MPSFGNFSIYYKFMNYSAGKPYFPILMRVSFSTLLVQSQNFEIAKIFWVLSMPVASGELVASFGNNFLGSRHFVEKFLDAMDLSVLRSIFYVSFQRELPQFGFFLTIAHQQWFLIFWNGHFLQTSANAIVDHAQQWFSLSYFESFKLTLISYLGQQEVITQTLQTFNVFVYSFGFL